MTNKIYNKDKMRIGLLTMTFNNNYGGMLQAYALMTHLKKNGYSPTLLNVQFPFPPLYKLPYTIPKRFLLKYLFKSSSIDFVVPDWAFVMRKKIVEKNTNYFIQKYIQPKTNKITRNSAFGKRTKGLFDAYVVGSDQVWRPDMYYFINQAFFSFEKNNDILLLSYAASFGLDKWLYTTEQTDTFKSQLKRFVAVSVREDSAVDLCKRYFDKDAVQVIDPTMLLTPDDYLQLVLAENEPKHEGGILSYYLDPSEDKLAILRMVQDKFGLAVFNVNVKSKDRASALSDQVYPTVTSWLRGFMDAQFVVTDSYHGCVFAILFNKPFLVFGNIRRGLTRFTSLLDLFGLRSRLLLSLDEYDASVLDQKIDWGRINNILTEQRSFATNFLKTSLRFKSAKN